MYNNINYVVSFSDELNQVILWKENTYKVIQQMKDEIRTLQVKWEEA